MSQYNQSTEEDGVDLASLLNLLVGKWYLFVLCAILAVALGAGYLYFQPKVYQKFTTILIKDSQKGGGTSAAFADMAGIKGLSVSSVENEMLVLKSQALMERVVLDLGLHITYKEHVRFRDVEMYEYLPFKLIESKPGTLMPGIFSLKAINANCFELRLADETITGRFNEEMLFPFGLATVESYPQYLQNNIGKEIEVSIANARRTAAALRGGLSTTVLGETSIMRVGILSSRPGKGADALNKLIEVYNEAAVDDKNLVFRNTELFIQERLVKIREELGSMDGRIEDFKRTTLTANVSSDAGMYLQKANTLEEQIMNVDLQEQIVAMLDDFLAKSSNKAELLPINVGLENPSLNVQIQTYNDNMLRYHRLMAASSERNPIVADMGQTLETSRRSIQKSVQDMKHSILLQRNELNHRTKKTTGKIEAASSNERNLLTIQRDQKIKEELYLYLLSKSEENAIVKSMTEPNARVVDFAFGSDAPISPRNSIVLFSMLIVGCILPAAYFIIKDFCYTKVRGRSDVTKVVAAPVLGEIPSKPAAQKEDFLVVKPKSMNQISEAFRILRTNLNFMDTENKHKVIAFTSTLPAEGKTYVSANMAMTLSLSGKKVCIVGLDLRRPTLQVAFGLKGAKGVTDYLSDPTADLNSLIQPIPESDNLFILPTGTIPPNPAELLMQTRFDQMFSLLRQEFDYIIIDNPPVNIVADTTISNRVADITLYVVRAGVLDRRSLPMIDIIYREKKLNNMGIVITDIDYSKLYYSVGYQGYGKYYGYYGEYNDSIN